MAELKQPKVLMIEVLERNFEIQDIRHSGGEILADVFDAQDDDNAIIGLFILDDTEAETIAEENGELAGFTDETGRDGEHTTVDFYIPFEVYFEELDDEERFDVYQKQLIEAISHAISEQKI